MQKITDNVYVETGFNGCNVSFVVTKEGVVMIETPMVPTEAIQWRDEIAKHGKVRYIINNEPHFDHMSGDYFFDGLVVAQDGSRERIKNSPVKELTTRLEQMAPKSLPLPDDFHFCLPDITLSEKMTIYLGDHTFVLEHLPGHTASQLAVYVPEERVVFTSDNVVNGGPSFMHEAVPYAWLTSLKRIQQLDVDTVVPGHGELCTTADIPKMAAWVQNGIDKVTDAMNRGLTVEQAQQEYTAADIFPGLGPSPMADMVKNMNINRLYQVLGKK